METKDLKNGQKVTLNVKYVGKKKFESKFGTCYIVDYVDEKGDFYTYKGATPVIDEEFGNGITATIKIESYRGIDKVYLQRIKIINGRTPIQVIKEKEQQIKDSLIKEELEREKEIIDFMDKKLFNVLIGKTVSFYGWQYDNSDTYRGVIFSFERELKESTFRKLIKISVKSDSGVVKNFTLNLFSLKSLIEKGSVKSNKYLNSGHDIDIID